MAALEIREVKPLSLAPHGRVVVPQSASPHGLQHESTTRRTSWVKRAAGPKPAGLDPAAEVQSANDFRSTTRHAPGQSAVPQTNEAGWCICQKGGKGPWATGPPSATADLSITGLAQSLRWGGLARPIGTRRFKILWQHLLSPKLSSTGQFRR
jgi:hypothetical protein